MSDNCQHKTDTERGPRINQQRKLRKTLEENRVDGTNCVPAYYVDVINCFKLFLFVYHIRKQSSKEDIHTQNFMTNADKAINLGLLFLLLN